MHSAALVELRWSRLGFACLSSRHHRVSCKLFPHVKAADSLRTLFFQFRDLAVVRRRQELRLKLRVMLVKSLRVTVGIAAASTTAAAVTISSRLRRKSYQVRSLLVLQLSKVCLVDDLLMAADRKQKAEYTFGAKAVSDEKGDGIRATGGASSCFSTYLSENARSISRQALPPASRRVAGLSWSCSRACVAARAVRLRR